MEKSKIIEERIKKAFERLSVKFSVPVSELRIAIICKQVEEKNTIVYAAFSKSGFLGNIGLTEVVDLSFMGFNMVTEKTVMKSILNKFDFFSIPINAEPAELRVFIFPTNGAPLGFLYRGNDILNNKGFNIGSLFD